MVLYFIVRINRRSIDRDRGAYTNSLRETDALLLSDEDHQWINSYICNPDIPGFLAKNPSFNLNANTANIHFINKGEMDKGVTGFGVIIKSDEKKVNFLPISFLESTKENVLYVKNDQKNLIGLFTPFHIILFDTVSLKFSQSVENDNTDEIENIQMISYTKDNKSIGNISIKVNLPFLEPCQFAETYYLAEFKDFRERCKRYE